MRKTFVFGALALGLAGCCLCGGASDEHHDVGQHYSGATYIECRPTVDASDCAQRFRDLCHGDYDEVAADHVHDFDAAAPDGARLAFCRD